MTTLRVTALILLVSAGMAFAQNPPQPCGPGVFSDNEFWFVDTSGEPRSFCVRERKHLKFNGQHTLKAAVTGSRYCTDIDKQFGDIKNCHFIGMVRCNQKTDPPEYVITVRFMNCRGLFGRKFFTQKMPLADVLNPPASPSGAFVSP